MAIKVLNGCGVLKVDNDTILLNDTTNVISVDTSRLITDSVAFISVPSVFTDLAMARTVSANLRDALVSAGVMLADV